MIDYSKLSIQERKALNEKVAKIRKETLQKGLQKISNAPKALFNRFGKIIPKSKLQIQKKMMPLKGYKIEKKLMPLKKK